MQKCLTENVYTIDAFSAVMFLANLVPYWADAFIQHHIATFTM